METSLDLSCGVSQSIDEIDNAIVRLNIASPTPITDITLTFYRDRKDWARLLNAVAKIPRDSVLLSFVSKNGIKRDLPLEALAITARHLTIMGVKIPSPLQFLNSPRDLRLNNCENPHGIQIVDSFRSLCLSSLKCPVELRTVNLKSLKFTGTDAESLARAPLSGLEYLGCALENKKAIIQFGDALLKMPKVHTLRITVLRSLIGNLLEVLRDCVISPIRVLTLIAKPASNDSDTQGFDWFPAMDNLQILQLSKFRLGANPATLFADLPMLKTLMFRNVKMEKIRDPTIIGETTSDDVKSIPLDGNEIARNILARHKQATKSKRTNLIPEGVRVRVMSDSAGID